MTLKKLQNESAWLDVTDWLRLWNNVLRDYHDWNTEARNEIVSLYIKYVLGKRIGPFNLCKKICLNGRWAGIKDIKGNCVYFCPIERSFLEYFSLN